MRNKINSENWTKRLGGYTWGKAGGVPFVKLESESIFTQEEGVDKYIENLGGQHLHNFWILKLRLFLRGAIKIWTFYFRGNFGKIMKWEKIKSWIDRITLVR